MRKRLYIIFTVVFSLLVLAGCNSAESPSAPVPESSTAPSEQPEITQDELYRQFEQVYDDFGASVAQDQEQLAVELEALEKISANSEAIWPSDYETLYESWREDTIAKRAASLQKDYEEIIAKRTLYEQGVDGLWETRPGLHYASYLDFDNDGKQELLLLSDCHIVEIYGDEKGHAVKYCEQSLGIIESSNYYHDEFEVLLGGVSLAWKDGRPLIGAITYGTFPGSSHHPEGHTFYTLENKILTVFSMVQLTDMGDFDLGALEYPYAEVDPAVVTASDLCAHSVNGTMTEEEYRDKYAEHILVSNYEGPQDTGILPKDKIFPVPRVEVNGELLELEVAPYAYCGELMAPLRDVLEAMGIAVYANADVSVILASSKNDTLTIANRDYSYIGIAEGKREYISYRYSINDSKPVNIFVESSGGKICVPIQTIVPLFGAQAEWDSAEKTIRITSNVAKMSQDEIQNIVDFSFEKASKIAEQYGYSVGQKTFTDYNSYSYDEYGKYRPAVRGGLSFKNGIAIWYFFVDGDVYEDYSNGATWNMFGAEARSDGTFVLHRDDEVWTGVGQI